MEIVVITGIIYGGFMVILNLLKNKFNYKELNENEIIFLKFMNNKNINLSFSPRWEALYGIKPRVTLNKLIKLGYLKYSDYRDALYKDTIKNIKIILKNYNLSISGSKDVLINRVIENVEANKLIELYNNTFYVLTQTGKEIIDNNKVLFMSKKEKAGDNFKELTNTEYTQLQVLKKTDEYLRLKSNELSPKNGYTKNDILWAIYNDVALTSTFKQDYFYTHLAYKHMSSILYNEKKYEKAFSFLILAIYLRFDDVKNSDLLFQRHIKKYDKEVIKYFNKSSIHFNSEIEIYNYIKTIIKTYQKQFYVDKYIKKLSNEYSKILIY